MSMAKKDLLQILKSACVTNCSSMPNKKATMEKKAPPAPVKMAQLTKAEALVKAASLAVMLKAGVKSGTEKRAALRKLIAAEGVDASLNAVLKFVEG
jgi:hypothetical protein